MVAFQMERRLDEMLAPFVPRMHAADASAIGAERCSCSSRSRTKFSAESQSSPHYPSIRLIASRNTLA